MMEVWRWSEYPELKGKGLRCMAESTDGSIWFGTDRGVMGYDGLDWWEDTPENGLLGSPVYVLASSSDGSLYAGTELGISRRQDGQWDRFFPKKGSLPWPINDLIVSRDGAVWAATGWGLLRIHESTQTLYTTEPMRDVLEHHTPNLDVRVLPEGLIPTVSWWEDAWGVLGIGVRVVEGAWPSLRNRSTPRFVYALSGEGPAAGSGLKVGDRIVTVDGVRPAWTNDALKGQEGSVAHLQVERDGVSGLLEFHIPRRRVPGYVKEGAFYCTS